MTTHLSSDQISRLMIGEGDPHEKLHARECSVCSEELIRLQETLAVFRGSVERWADHSGGARGPECVFSTSTRSASRNRPLAWALAAVLVVLVSIPFYKNFTDHGQEAQAVEDAVLLEQVNAQLSRVVPEPMEPFMNFVAGATSEVPGGRQ